VGRSMTAATVGEHEPWPQLHGGAGSAGGARPAHGRSSTAAVRAPRMRSWPPWCSQALRERREEGLAIATLKDTVAPLLVPCSGTPSPRRVASFPGQTPKLVTSSMASILVAASTCTRRARALHVARTSSTRPLPGAAAGASQQPLGTTEPHAWACELLPGWAAPLLTPTSARLHTLLCEPWDACSPAVRRGATVGSSASGRHGGAHWQARWGS
jgi:hypothetical protein